MIDEMIDKFISIVNGTEKENSSFFEQDVNAAKAKSPNKKDLLIEALEKIKSLLQLSNDQLKAVKDRDTFDEAIRQLQSGAVKLSAPSKSPAAAPKATKIKEKIIEISKAGKENFPLKIDELSKILDDLDQKSIEDVIKDIAQIDVSSDTRLKMVVDFVNSKLQNQTEDEDYEENDGGGRDDESSGEQEEFDQNKYIKSYSELESSIREINKVKLIQKSEKEELIKNKIETFFEEMGENLDAIQILKESITSIGESSASEIRSRFGMQLKSLIGVIDSFIEERGESEGGDIEDEESSSEPFGGTMDPRKWEYGNRNGDDDGDDEDDGRGSPGELDF